MKYVQKRKSIIILPENIKDRKKLKDTMVNFIEAGYRIEKRTWGGYVVSDPTMKFSWEINEVLTDVKKIIGEL